MKRKKTAKDKQKTPYVLPRKMDPKAVFIVTAAKGWCEEPKKRA